MAFFSNIAESTLFLSSSKTVLLLLIMKTAAQPQMKSECVETVRVTISLAMVRLPTRSIVDFLSDISETDYATSCALNDS